MLIGAARPGTVTVFLYQQCQQRQSALCQRSAASVSSVSAVSAQRWFSSVSAVYVCYIQKYSVVRSVCLLSPLAPIGRPEMSHCDVTPFGRSRVQPARRRRSHTSAGARSLGQWSLVSGQRSVVSGQWSCSSGGSPPTTATGGAAGRSTGSGLADYRRLKLATPPGTGSLETFGGPQRHAIAHLKAGKIVTPNMSSVMLGKSVLF